MRLLIAAVLGLFVFAGQPAQAQMISAANPDGIVEALQKLGYRAQLEASNSGSPVIRSTIEGVNYSIWFYGCTDNIGCTGLNFSTGFDLENGTTMEIVNDWNRRKLVGRAYLVDDMDPFIDFFVVANGSGLPADTFERVISRWGLALAQFRDHIDY